MKFIHMSERYNRESIFKNGLLPSKILLDYHLKSFREDKYLLGGEDKILYTWESGEKDNKFIKDMVYCKIWIQPRNRYYDPFNFKNKNNIFYWVPYLNMIYDVYELQILNILNLQGREVHIQEPSDDYHNTLYEMDDKYSHNDKKLYFSKTKETNFRIIKEVKLDINKNGKINIKIR